MFPHHALANKQTAEAFEVFIGRRGSLLGLFGIETLKSKGLIYIAVKDVGLRQWAKVYVLTHDGVKAQKGLVCDKCNTWKSWTESGYVCPKGCKGE